MTAWSTVRLLLTAVLVLGTLWNILVERRLNRQEVGLAYICGIEDAGYLERHATTISYKHEISGRDLGCDKYRSAAEAQLEKAK